MAKTEKRNAKAKAPIKLKKVTPTFRQRIAFELLSDLVRKSGDRKKITIGKVLEKAGYSKYMQEAPSKVTESAGWQVLLEQKFPDGLISERMGEQLNAQQIDHYIFSSKTPNEEIKEIIEKDFGFKVMRISRTGTWKRAYFSIPDHLSRDKIIDKILKLKNKYPAEKHEHAVAIVQIIDHYGK